MPDRARLRHRLAQRPNAVRFDEVVALLEAYGWVLVQVRGSHHRFRRGAEQVVIPHRRPTVLAVYVRQALKATQEGGDD